MPPSRGGWLIVDKPVGISSSQVVQRLRRSSGMKALGIKVGHAGTLDPLASGVLPVALGEATKTVGFLTKAIKRYRFRIRWGEARDTDDGEGKVVAENPLRPDPAAIAAMLPHFTGIVAQVPPAFSAIKVAGRRAYALARSGCAPQLRERLVQVADLSLIAVVDRDHADFVAEVGEGTYIRSLARDLAVALGTVGHVSALRRLSVGRFAEDRAISLDSLVALGHSLFASGHLLPIEAALDDIPALTLTADEAARLRHGQQVTLESPGEGTGLGRLDDGTIVGARYDQLLIGLARIENGRLRPVRIIND